MFDKYLKTFCFRKGNKKVIDNIDLAIIIPSYNKESYISETIESILMQKTQYTYHIIVTDDHSTDNTISIVQKYKEKYPDTFTLLESTENQKLFKNILKAYQIIKTKYFCVIDADDYWIDEHKIQKALDFLETHDSHTIYISGVDMLTKEGKIEPFIHGEAEEDFSLDDFFSNKVHVLGCTISSIFRNVVFSKGIPKNMLNLSSSTYERSFRGDTFRTFIHLEKGMAHFDPSVTGIYRITDQGIWTSMSQIRQLLLNANLFRDLWLYFDTKYPSFLFTSSYFFCECLKNHKLFAYLVDLSSQERLDVLKQLSGLEELRDKYFPSM